MKDNKEKYNHVEYVKRYNKEHYKLITLQMPSDFFNRISTYIEITGEKKSEFVKRCIKKTIERDKRKWSEKENVE